jgi:starch phosphorylase
MLHFGEVKIDTVEAEHVFKVQTYLGEVDPDGVRVEPYANGINGEGPVRQEMKRVRQLVGAAKGYAYRARLGATRPATDFTARRIPRCAGAAVSSEAARILWQR